MEAWLWLTAALALAAGEAMAPGSFVLVFFAFGAAVTAAARAAGWAPALWQQSALCLAAATLALVALRRRLRRPQAATSRQFGDLIGAEAEISSPLAPGARGPAVLNGVPWQAMNAGSSPLAAGERVVVHKVRGLTLEVVRSGQEAGQ